MGPDPTRAYIWPAVNKRLTRLWPGYFLHNPKRFFLHKKTWMADPTRATKNWPDLTRVKTFWSGPITTLYFKRNMVKTTKTFGSFKIITLIVKLWWKNQLRVFWLLIMLFVQYRKTLSKLLFIYINEKQLFLCLRSFSSSLCIRRGIRKNAHCCWLT